MTKKARKDVITLQGSRNKGKSTTFMLLYEWLTKQEKCCLIWQDWTTSDYRAIFEMRVGELVWLIGLISHGDSPAELEKWLERVQEGLEQRLALAGDLKRVIAGIACPVLNGKRQGEDGRTTEVVREFGREYGYCVPAPIEKTVAFSEGERRRANEKDRDEIIRRFREVMEGSPQTALA